MRIFTWLLETFARPLYVIALLAIQSVMRIITSPIITRYAIRRRSITRVSPLIGISQDRKLVRVRKKRKKALATARERAWVLARYDAIMRYGPRRREGGQAGRRRETERARKRGTERIGRANKKKRNQTRWRRRRKKRGTDGPATLTLTRPEVEVGWGAAGPSCRVSLSTSRPPEVLSCAPRHSARTDGPHRACPVVLHSQTPPSRTSQKVH